MHALLVTCCLASVAIAGAFFGEAVGLPAAWLFSFLVVFGVAAIVRDRQYQPNARLATPAQVIIALMCAAPLATINLPTMAGFVMPTLLSLLVTLAVCVLAAWMLVRYQQVRPNTATLATLAGGASAMSLLAVDLRADFRFVTLAQFLRLSIVVLTLPLFVLLLAAEPVHAQQASINWVQQAQAVLGCLVVWLVVWLLSKRIAISSPYLLVSLALGVVALVVGVPPEYVSPSGPLADVAFAIIGVQAGGTLTKSALRQFIHALPLLLTAIGMMIGGSLATAWLMHQWWDFSMLDAYLATVPGGVYAVLAFAHEAGSGPLVTVIQVMRVIAMLLVGALVPHLFSRRISDGGR